MPSNHCGDGDRGGDVATGNVGNCKDCQGRATGVSNWRKERGAVPLAASKHFVTAGKKRFCDTWQTPLGDSWQTRASHSFLKAIDHAAEERVDKN